MSGLSEADTRAKMIDPAIHKRGWTEDLIRREETAGSIEIINGKARRRSKGKVDYVLRVKVNPGTQPVAVALIEAKKDTLPPGHGLDQRKGYAECKRLNVPFVFSSNGHQFVMFDRFSGLTSAPRPMTEFPSPAAYRLLTRPTRKVTENRPKFSRTCSPKAKGPLGHRQRDKNPGENRRKETATYGYGRGCNRKRDGERIAGREYYESRKRRKRAIRAGSFLG